MRNEESLVNIQVDATVIKTESELNKFFRDYWFSKNKLLALYALIKCGYENTRAAKSIEKEIDQGEGNRHFYTQIMPCKKLLVMTDEGKVGIIGLDDATVKAVCGIVDKEKEQC